MKQVFKSLPGLGLPWKAASVIKNQLYDRSVLPIYQAPIPVMSIGNLTMGGTGKTPMILDLVHWFEDQYRVAVINRSYGGSLKKSICLDPRNKLYSESEPKTASVVGDEALLLQNSFKKTSVFTGPNKSQSAEFAAQNSDLDFLIVDDGFQHRRLSRDCDVVILDATETMNNYECFPAGRGREDFSSLLRADAIFITKTNLAPVIQVQKLMQRIDQLFQQNQMNRQVPIYQFDFLIDRVERVEFLEGQGRVARHLVSTKELTGQDWLAVSAIGNPESFERSAASLQLRLTGHLKYPDHHSYKDQDLIEIHEKSIGKKIMITEKDLVKWAEMKIPKSMDVYVLCQRVSCQSDQGTCYLFLYEKMMEKYGTRI